MSVQHTTDRNSRPAGGYMEFADIPGTGLKVSRIALGTWAIGGWMWGGTDEASRSQPSRPRSSTASTSSTPPRSTASADPRRSSARRSPTACASTCADCHQGRARMARRQDLPQRQPRPHHARGRGLAAAAADRPHRHLSGPLARPAAADRRNGARDARAATSRARSAPSASAISPSQQMDEFRTRSAVARPAAALQSVRARHRDRDPALLPQAIHRHARLWRALPRAVVGPHARRHQVRGRRSARDDPKFQPPRFAQYLAAVEQLDRLARKRYGKRVIHLAVRWVLDQGITTALWGARRPDQLAPVEAAMGWSLDASAKAEIDRILAKTVHDPVGPEFMAPPEYA